VPPGFDTVGDDGQSVVELQKGTDHVVSRTLDGVGGPATDASVLSSKPAPGHSRILLGRRARTR
jgi:hypothetical protein